MRAIILALTAMLTLSGAKESHAALIGPNSCEEGSTATTCNLTLNVIKNDTTYTYGDFVKGTISITGEKQLTLRFNSNNTNGFDYKIGDLWLNAANLNDVMSTSTSQNYNISIGYDVSNRINRRWLTAVSYDPITSTSPINEGYQAGSWGDFNLLLDTNNGSASSVSDVSFVFNFGNIVWTDLLSQQFLVLNGYSNPIDASGQSVAGHVYEFLDGVATGNTYYAAWASECENCSNNIPEPGALPLVALGLGGIVAVRRRYTV